MKVTEVFKKVILVIEVSMLARQLARDNRKDGSVRKAKAKEGPDWDFSSYGDALLRGDVDGDDDDESGSAQSNSPLASGDVNPYSKSLKSSERQTLLELLDQWEEPAKERDLVSGRRLLLSRNVIGC